jgi:dTDP-L-rhamnose 4-epimerase
VRVLVTGGAGFIGTAVVDALVDAGHEVCVLDLRTPQRSVEGVRYLRADARDEQAWLDALDGVDAVCHQAAKVGLGVDFADVVDYASHNDLATAVGLRALHQRGFAGRLVLASSMVVYGEGAYRCPRCGPVRAEPRPVEALSSGRFDPPCPHCGDELAPESIIEDAPLDPRNVYAATKLHQEHLCSVWAREHQASAVALRYHNVYGPGLPLDTPYAGVAALFRSKIASGNAPQVFEDGGQLRDFVHVADVAQANVAAVSADLDASFVAANVCSGRPRSILDLAQAMCDAMGSALEPVVTGAWRLGDVRHVFASPERAASLLGFKAAIGLEEGLVDLVEDWR